MSKNLLEVFKFANIPMIKFLMEINEQFTNFVTNSKKLSTKKITTYQQLVKFLMYLMI